MDIRIHTTLNTQKDLEQFGQISEQKEEYFAEYLNEDQQVPMQVMPQEKVERREMKSDMPAQNVDEKESKRIERYKKKFVQDAEKIPNQKDEEVVEANRTFANAVKENAGNYVQSNDVYELDPAIFTPAYVLENFPEVRMKLNKWKIELDAIKLGSKEFHALPEYLQKRRQIMQRVYELSEVAVKTAMKALGFTYKEEKDGTVSIHQTEKKADREKALKENRQWRESMSEHRRDLMDHDRKELLKNARHEITARSLEKRKELQDQKKHPEFASIRSAFLNDETQYVRLTELKQLLQNPEYQENYKENQTLLDALFEEYFHLEEVLARYSEEDEIINSYDRERAHDAVQASIEKDSGIWKAKIDLIKKRADRIKGGMQHLLKGEKLTTEEAAIMWEYGPVRGEKEKERRDAQEQARIYVQKDAAYSEYEKERMRKKYLDRYEEEKATIRSYLEQIRDYDISELASCSKEELLARNEELQELCVRGQRLAEKVNTYDPDNRQRLTFRQSICPNEALFLYKCRQIDAYAAKARTLGIARAYKEGSLTLDCFTNEEIQEIYIRNKLRNNMTPSLNMMLDYAKEKQKKAEVASQVSKNQYSLAGIVEIERQIGQLQGMPQDQKLAVKKHLEAAEDWMKDLTRYLDQSIDLSDESFFDASVQTLLAIFGNIEQNIRLSKKELKGAPDLCEKMDQIAGTFTEIKQRIPGYAQDERKRILQSREEKTLKPAMLLAGVPEIKKFFINEQMENVGSGVSDVFKIEEDTTYFFKKEEHVEKIDDAIRSILPILEDEQLQEKILKSGNLSEEKVRELRGFGWESKGLLERIIGEKDKGILTGYIERNPERWKKFVDALKKQNNLDIMRADGTLTVEVGANLVNRNFATERVAELFGLKGLIVRNREAQVTDQQGITQKGFVMDQAKGIPAIELREKFPKGEYQIQFTGEVQKQLINLQILDNIVGQTDRHMSNLYLDYDEVKEEKIIVVKSITAIDNDLAFTKTEKLGSGTNTGSVFNNEENQQYILGMMDKRMYEALMSVSPELLIATLENVIEPEYQDALVARFKKVREIIQEAKKEADKQKIDFFREKEGWGETSQEKLLENATMKWDDSPEETEKKRRENKFRTYMSRIINGKY